MERVKSKNTFKTKLLEIANIVVLLSVAIAWIVLITSSASFLSDVHPLFSTIQGRLFWVTVICVIVTVGAQWLDKTVESAMESIQKLRSIK